MQRIVVKSSPSGSFLAHPLLSSGFVPRMSRDSNMFAAVRFAKLLPSPGELTYVPSPHPPEIQKQYRGIEPPPTHRSSHPFTQSPSHPVAHPFTQPPINPFIHPPVHLPTHPPTHAHSSLGEGSNRATQDKCQPPQIPSY